MKMGTEGSLLALLSRPLCLLLSDVDLERARGEEPAKVHGYRITQVFHDGRMQWEFAVRHCRQPMSGKADRPIIGATYCGTAFVIRRRLAGHAVHGEFAIDIGQCPACGLVIWGNDEAEWPHQGATVLAWATADFSAGSK